MFILFESSHWAHVFHLLNISVRIGIFHIWVFNVWLYNCKVCFIRNVSLAYLGPIYGLCLKQFHALDIWLETIKNPLSLWQTLMQSLASRYIKMKICFFMEAYATPIHLLLVQRHSLVIEADLTEKKVIYTYVAWIYMYCIATHPKPT